MQAEGLAQIDPANWVSLVWRVVNDVSRPGDRKGELFSEGSVALLDAVRNWEHDHESGAAFMTYAYACIRNRIKGLRKAERNYRGCLPPHSGRCSSRRLILFSEFGSNFIRGKAPVFAVVPSAEKEFDNREHAQTLLAPVLRSLPIRCLTVLRLRFGIGGPEHTLRETGRKIGLSIQRVRQIEVRAIMKIRSRFRLAAGA